MRYALIGLGVLVCLALAVVVMGALLPVEHHASRRATFAASAPTLFAVLTDVASYPQWRTGVERVEIISSDRLHRRFREVGAGGSIEYAMDVTPESTRLVSTIVGGVRAFGGSWTFEVVQGDSTTLRIIEEGKIYNPVFRFVSRFIIGYHATIDRYLTDLGTRLGEPVVPGE